MLKAWLTRLRFLIAPKRRHEIDEELQFHIEQQIQANLAAGMTPQEARRQAVIAFGGIEGAKEGAHEQRPSVSIETFVQDTRYALRGFARSPIFTVTVVIPSCSASERPQQSSAWWIASCFARYRTQMATVLSR